MTDESNLISLNSERMTTVFNFVTHSSFYHPILELSRDEAQLVSGRSFCIILSCVIETSSIVLF